MARAFSTLQSTHFAGREMEAQKGVKWFITQDDSSSERTGFCTLLSKFIPAKVKNETKDFLISLYSKIAVSLPQLPGGPMSASGFSMGAKNFDSEFCSRIRG